MARVDIPVTKLGLFGGSLADVKALATAADAANDHEFKNDGKQALVVFNDSAGVVNVTAKAVANANTFNRSVDTSLAVAAGEVGLLNFLDPTGFSQSGGTVNIDVDVDVSISMLCMELAK